MLKGLKPSKIILAIAIFMIAAGAAGTWRFFSTVQERRSTEDIRLFGKVLGIVKTSYVEEVQTKKLLEGAINGMLASLDPHSAYLPPEPFNEMKVEMSGSFGGLGIEISIKDGKLTVIAPIEDTPAYRAGVLAGDHIWKIDDKPTRGLTITEAVKRMRGPKGTKVTLSILRNGDNTAHVFPLIRDIIKTKSLKVRALEPGYGYVRLGHFTERTGEEFLLALQKLRRENGGELKGLVLDLRNNPGGLLDAAVSVTGRFVGGKIDDGLVVYTEGRESNAKRELFASVGEKEPNYPMVVLVNGGSASASEIVAGALQDHGRAVIMGTQTFGKGSVQSVIPLRGGAGLKLTTARYYTPKGRSIQAKGIVPDIIVPRADMKPLAKGNGKENNEEKGFREKDLEHHLPGVDKDKNVKEKDGKDKDGKESKQPPEPITPLGDDTSKDNQLLRALELLKGWTTVKGTFGPGK